ncbi:hypothetical protein ACFX1Z_027227 [Malus domestica]
MRFKIPNMHHLLPKTLKPLTATESQIRTRTLPLDPLQDLDDALCSDHHQQQQEQQTFSYTPPLRCLTGESRIERAWDQWSKLGRPKLIVAPSTGPDGGQLGAPVSDALRQVRGRRRSFSQRVRSTGSKNLPLARTVHYLFNFALMILKFCWTLQREWRLIVVDINLGCPQRIPLIKSLVENLVQNLNVPVSCKVCIFPNLEDTIKYARMLEDAGCSLLAVHGRTRDEKDQKKVQANWEAIRAVKNALRIPVLANGNIRHMDDVRDCLEATSADGVLSAESLLENPTLFAGFRTAKWAAENEESRKDGKLDQADLLVEYLKLCEQYPVPWPMIRAHVHSMLREWFRIHPHIREDLNAQNILTFGFLYDIVDRLRELGVGVPLHLKDTNAETVSANRLSV